MLLWKKVLCFGILFLFLLNISLAVNLDTNLTLRAECVNAYGNPCTDTGRWTVITPNGTTLYNNTQGGVYAYGVSNFTIWFNQSGNWFVVTNFSAQNVTQTFNVVVENYGTGTISSEMDMIASFFLLGIIIFSLIYAGFKIDKEHVVMKWILVLCGIVLTVPAAWMARLASGNSSVNSIYESVWIVFIFILISLIVYLIIYSFTFAVKRMLKLKFEKEKGAGRSDQE